jgi:anti-sigma-K factor RskA
MTADPHTYAGAYVLHALSEAERAEFEEHLADCESCAQEARELAATAGRLGSAVAAVPPPALKRQVMRRITTVRQRPPDVPPDVPPERPGTERRAGRSIRSLPRLVLAACLAAAVLGGGVAVWQYQRAEDAREQMAASEQGREEMMRVLTAADVRVSKGSLPGGARATVLVSSDRDRAVFVAADLPAPPSGMVYQLWFDDGGQMRPAGLLEPDAGHETAAMLMDGPVDRAGGMGVTVEPAGGSPAPTSDPLVVMPFPKAAG